MQKLMCSMCSPGKLSKEQKERTDTYFHTFPGWYQSTYFILRSPIQRTNNRLADEKIVTKSYSICKDR